MIEVERKFRLSEEAAQNITSVLFTGDPELEPTRQVDDIFMRNGESYETFYQGQPVLRLRTVDDVILLTYKRTLNDEGDSIEHEVEVGDQSIMRLMLEEMGYWHVTSVRKERAVKQMGRLAFMLDQVSGLGQFLEIKK